MSHVVRSILLNFLELADILSKDPQDAADKINDLQTLFFNVHHLLNENRPHQARETLIAMMEQRIASMRTNIEQVKTMETKVNELLGGLGELGEDGADVPDADKQEKDKAEQARASKVTSLWTAMSSIEP